MQIKNGVILSGLDIHMQPVLKAADRVWRDHGQELVVTSGLEGTHSAGSLHYYGRALDFRTRFWERSEQEEVLKEMTTILEDTEYEYDLILHSTHLHVEYDPNCPGSVYF